MKNQETGQTLLEYLVVVWMFFIVVLASTSLLSGVSLNGEPSTLDEQLRMEMKNKIEEDRVLLNRPVP